ncbi:MAG: chloride channel protein, partial [Acidimicrobiales bacterium]
VAAFVIPDYAITSYWEIPAFALLGVTCAAVAVIFQFALTGTDYFARNIAMPLWARPAVGGLAVDPHLRRVQQAGEVGAVASDRQVQNRTHGRAVDRVSPGAGRFPNRGEQAKGRHTVSFRSRLYGASSR